MTVQGSLKSQSFKQWELAQLARNRYTRKVRVLGSRVQVLLEVAFLWNLFCSNTILASMPGWSTLGKPRLITTQNHTLSYRAPTVQWSTRLLLALFNWLWNLLHDKFPFSHKQAYIEVTFYSLSQNDASTDGYRCCNSSASQSVFQLLQKVSYLKL